MLKKRLVPKLQMTVGSFGKTPRMVLVTTLNFDRIIEIGDPVSQAKIYQAQAADELVFLDIRASEQSRSTTLDVVKRAAEHIFMPFTVGGGVRTLEDFRVLLTHGADKVSVNTAAVEDPTLIDRAAKVFGAQCVVLSIDYRRDADGRQRVYTRGGKARTELDPVEWALEAERRGAGELLLTSIDRDGTRMGLDVETSARIAERVSIPVVLSGGCGLASHFSEGFLAGKASAVSAGTFFCFRDQNPMQTRAQIRNAGIPIRVHT